MTKLPVLAASALFLCIQSASAETLTIDTSFKLTSPAFESGDTLPADLKCQRDQGDGLSPPLNWTTAPAGSKSLALIMHHYPRGTIEGRDAPSQYWLLWNIPVETTKLKRGNPLSIGTEGSDKDGRRTGYTPPCSPPGPQHKYTITIYALNGMLDNLPTQDSLSVDWQTMTDAMQGKIISSSKIEFLN
ncbi:YbhB/YbcL family Raf kinase inhibitor-like protein [Marinomonas sp. C2222]|uniref:YbhB/YbcL family Raf kinase inhibitor-like protein n=1 Tax=Marinomonas sargassi TaxID=2984494 RepID=A0ABT2YN15_9GAMM|nr:YbhB/YbcL family Raf kinase inhibitor-like protein [Marinomonas sargassi]MCV2401271.1 YbhB/YbcL family Raf kinase inhibitor-like protein [Marinomonas sargassi]